MFRNQLWAGAAALVGAGIISVATPNTADACGGFFCDGQQPVNQAAERIIFSDNDDGTVTAIVQIMYTGPSERFSWVLPVPSVPEIGVSSNLAFQRLQTATNPQYVLNTEVEGTCAVEPPRAEFDGAAQNNANGFNSVDAGASPNNTVGVVDRGTVGPYDYVVIEIDDQADDPVQSAVDWLETNGYDVTALGPEVMRPYIEDGMYLLAFRLTKQADSGDIRPVSLTYQTDVPMIPIKLTAVAANADMGVMTWVLGNSRAVPMTYKSLEINDALINWFNPMGTYDQVVSAAADEAMGQGFVTEYAGASEIADKIVFSDGDEQGWEYLNATNFASNTDDLVIEAWQLYGPGNGGVAWDGWVETINGFFGGLSDSERQEIIDCAACSPDLIPDSIDTTAFLTELDENVISPMRDTQELLDSLPYMTRLYTTMSAAEMTVDPVFDFNPDLADKSRRHEATQVIECSPEYYRWEAPWRVELPSGNVVRGQYGSWPFQPGGMLPMNQRILQDSTDGEADVVEDNTMTIQQGITSYNDSVSETFEPGSADPAGNGDPDADVGGSGEDGENGALTMDEDASLGGSGCATGGGAASLFALLGLIGLRRRREDA